MTGLHVSHGTCIVRDMSGTQILAKKARDGADLTIALTSSPGTSWYLDIRKGARQVALVQTRPVVLDTPAGDCTHGIVVNRRTRAVVGLTADEAAAVSGAIEAHKASVRPSRQKTAEAVAALHCRDCGGRLSGFDIEAAAVEGVCFNCA